MDNHALKHFKIPEDKKKALEGIFKAKCLHQSDSVNVFFLTVQSTNLLCFFKFSVLQKLSYLENE